MMLKSVLTLSALLGIVAFGAPPILTGQDAPPQPSEQEASAQEAATQLASVAETSSQGQSFGQSNTDDGDNELRLYPLQQMGAEDAVRIIYQTLRPENTQLAADERTNTVIANGPAEEQTRIADLLKSADQPAGRAEEIKVFVLHESECREVANVLMQLMHGKDITLVPEAITNSILGRGSPDELAVVEAIIGNLDTRAVKEQTSEPEYGITVFALKATDANEAVDVLRTLLGAAGPAARFAIDVRTNSIIFAGSNKNKELVESVLKELDRSTEGNSGDNKEEAVAEEFHIFWLRYATAVETANFLNQMLGGGAFDGNNAVRIVPDEERNALFVSCATERKELVDYIGDVLKQVDVPSQEDDRTLTTLPLTAISAADAIGVLQTLMHGAPGARMSHNSDNNAIIFYGTPADTELVKAILEKLDIPAQEQISTSAPTNGHASQDAYKVRIIWLSNDSEDGNNLPEELHPVAEELASYGFENLNLAGQLMVNTTAQIECRGRINRGPNHAMETESSFDFQASGVLAGAGDRLNLNLNVDLQRNRMFNGGQGGSPTEFIAQTSTQILTQPGNFTVLGVSPTDTSTAIFVVQVLEE